MDYIYFDYTSVASCMHEPSQLSIKSLILEHQQIEL